MTVRPSDNLSRSRRTPDFRKGRSPTLTAITGGASMPRTRLHSETIAVVSAAEGSRFSLIEFVPPKTQSCVREIAYTNGASSQTIACARPSLGTIGNGDLAGAGELEELGHGDAAAQIARELAESFIRD